MEDDRILYMFKDGSRAWEGRDFIVNHPACKEVTLEGNSVHGKGWKDEPTEKTEL